MSLFEAVLEGVLWYVVCYEWEYDFFESFCYGREEGDWSVGSVFVLAFVLFWDGDDAC